MEDPSAAAPSKRFGVVTEGSTDTTDLIGKIRLAVEVFNLSKRELEDSEVGESALCLRLVVCGLTVLREDIAESDD